MTWVTALLGVFVNGGFKFLLSWMDTFQAVQTKVVQDDPQAPVFTDVGAVYHDLGV